MNRRPLTTIDSVTAQIEHRYSLHPGGFGNNSRFFFKVVSLSLVEQRLIKLASLLQMVYENVSGSPVVGCKNQVRLPPLCRLLIMAPEHKAHIKDCNIYNLPMGGQD